MYVFHYSVFILCAFVFIISLTTSLVSRVSLCVQYVTGLHAPRGGSKRDGSSIFYRSDRFVCRAFEAVAFFPLGLGRNAAAIACLQPIVPPPSPPRLPVPPIIVGCIHVLFNPKRGDHKLGQLRVLIERVEAQRSAAAQRQIKERGYATSSSTEAQLAQPDLPEPQVLMAGDFNAEPGSPLYHFLAAGELDCSRVDRRDMSGCLAEGEGGGESDWFMRMKSFGFDSDEGEDEEEWDDDWEKESSGKGGRKGKGKGGGQGRVKQSESEKVALRLADNFWDLEGLSLATGGGFGGCGVDGGDCGDGDDDGSIPRPLGAAIASKLATSEAVTATASSSTAAAGPRPEGGHAPTMSVEASRRRDAKRVRAMMSAIESQRAREGATGTGTEMNTGMALGMATPGVWSGRYKIEHCYKGRLHSCYARLCNGEEPPMTSCHRKFTGTVDYLWLTDGLAARRVLMPPAAPGGKLPSEKHPSDHISIVADVAFSS